MLRFQSIIRTRHSGRDVDDPFLDRTEGVHTPAVIASQQRGYQVFTNKPLDLYTRYPRQTGNLRQDLDFQPQIGAPYRRKPRRQFHITDGQPVMGQHQLLQRRVCDQLRATDTEPENTVPPIAACHLPFSPQPVDRVEAFKIRRESHTQTVRRIFPLPVQSQFGFGQCVTRRKSQGHFMRRAAAGISCLFSPSPFTRQAIQRKTGAQPWILLQNAHRERMPGVLFFIVTVHRSFDLPVARGIRCPDQTGLALLV
ncbi:hypothetical protein D3C81_727580 [compost metagenome]